MNITVLGAGSWGTTLAHLMSRKHSVSLWARSAASVSEINDHKTLNRYLDDASLHPDLTAHHELEASLQRRRDYYRGHSLPELQAGSG